MPKVGNVAWKPVDKDINYLLINSPTDVKMDVAKDIGDRQFWDSLPIKENQNIFK